MTETTTPDPVSLLALPLDGDNDARAGTVREYLMRLLEVAWCSGDGLHPFGNSGWQHDLYKPMTEAGLAAIGYDEDGYATQGQNHESYRDADLAILAAIKALREAPAPASATLARHLTAILDALSLAAQQMPGAARFAAALAALLADEAVSRATAYIHWGVAYGGDDPGECAGVLEYDDQAGAEEHAQWTVGGYVVRQEVVRGPWVRVAAELPDGGSQ